MTGQDLYQELDSKLRDLNMSIKMLRQTGSDYAAAERDYKIALRIEALKLRSEDGMPVTLINQIIYGVPDVAKLRYARDSKEAVYKANTEAIQSTKLQLRLIEAQISREYGRCDGV
jgi:hypothetical protein